VAVSTYEGDTENGKIAVWNAFSDFNAEKPADYVYDNVKDPEAVAFGADGTLFIACTYDSKIYFLTDLSKAPTEADAFYLPDGSSNPRGMTFDPNGKLYVMCENLFPESASFVHTVSNPALSSRTFAKLPASDQSGSNALDVCISGSTMFTTDYKDQSVRMYSFFAGDPSISYAKKLPDAGGTLNVTATGNTVYFTNDGGYLVQWNTLTDETQNILIGTSGIYAPWGIALYGGNLLVADAAHNKILVIDPTTATWN
jgi:DNA-binding beta-propeller fold protein YncE